MGFKFRRRKKIGRGVHVNISKKGVRSVSLGGKTAHVTIGKRRVTNTINTPVKGLTFSTTSTFPKGRRKSSAHRRSTSTGNASGIEVLFFLLVIAILVAIITLGPILLIATLFVGGVSLAVISAFAHKKFNREQIDQISPILYPNKPTKRRSFWRTYLKSERIMKELPQEIASMEYQTTSYTGEDVSVLCNMIKEYERKRLEYQKLNEIINGTDVNGDKPAQTDFASRAFRVYIKHTFTPVYEGAQSLKTEQGKKNRYIKYLDRFKVCHDQIPDSAIKEIEKLMAKHDIQISLK